MSITMLLFIRLYLIHFSNYISFFSFLSPSRWRLPSYCMWTKKDCFDENVFLLYILVRLGYVRSLSFSLPLLLSNTHKHTWRKDESKRKSAYDILCLCKNSRRMKLNTYSTIFSLSFFWSENGKSWCWLEYFSILFFNSSPYFIVDLKKSL